jgi:hypothetical protein
MDVKIYKNYIQNHQNWDHKYTLDVEKCTIYIDGCKKKGQYTSMDVKKYKNYIRNHQNSIMTYTLIH